jgi:hypothetical protein
MNHAMQKPSEDLFSRYQRWRRVIEPAFWIAFYCMQAVTNGWLTWVELQSLSLAGKTFKFWQPMGWFAFTNLVLLALLPAVVAFNRRYPLRLDTLIRHIPYHFLASVVYSFLHVIVTLALINAMYVYMHVGKKFAFGDFWSGLFFQYFRDVRFYLIVIVIVNFYRLIMLRWQGEASLLGAPDNAPPPESSDRPDCFLVRKLGKEFLLPATDIEWVQAQGNYVNLRVRARDYLLRSTIAGFEAKLDPKTFVRVHRSFIVNLAHLRELRPIESGDARALMADNSEVPVSRKYLDTLREAAAA